MGLVQDKHILALCRLGMHIHHHEKWCRQHSMSYLRKSKGTVFGSKRSQQSGQRPNGPRPSSSQAKSKQKACCEYTLDASLRWWCSYFYRFEGNLYVKCELIRDASKKFLGSNHARSLRAFHHSHAPQTGRLMKIVRYEQHARGTPVKLTFKVWCQGIVALLVLKKYGLHGVSISKRTR